MKKKSRKGQSSEKRRKRNRLEREEILATCAGNLPWVSRFEDYYKFPLNPYAVETAAAEEVVAVETQPKIVSQSNPRLLCEGSESMSQAEFL